MKSSCPSPNLTQRELRYAAIADLRSEYRPGQELECVVKEYDAEAGTLRISVKDMFANPFDGASDRHPVGCRRQATISGKYGGGVFHHNAQIRTLYILRNVFAVKTEIASKLS